MYWIMEDVDVGDEKGRDRGIEGFVVKMRRFEGLFYKWFECCGWERWGCWDFLYYYYCKVK